MEHDFRKKKVELMPEGWYEVLIIDGKTSLTRAGAERWVLKYEIKGVVDCQQTEFAMKFVGKEIGDFQIEHDNMQWRWDMFLRSVFPELEEAAKEIGDDYEPPFIKAEECVGRRLKVLIVTRPGNADRGEPEKINRCQRYAVLGVPQGEAKKSEPDDDLI